MDVLIKYISNNFGLETSLDVLASRDVAKLPLFLKHTYKYSKLRILEKHFVLAEPKEGTEYTPDQFAKHLTILERVFSSPVIFVFSDLDSWQRKRMIQKYIPFIQPGKQIYIPNLLLDVNDIISRNSEELEKKEKFSIPAQVVILYHLQVASLENLSFKEVAIKLGYSKMTLSRVVKEFELLDLVEIRGKREKSLFFKKRGKKQLWDSSLTLMKSPVRKVVFTDEHLAKPFLFGNDSALSVYTNLSASMGLSLAIGAIEYKIFQNDHKSNKDLINNNFGINRIEIWDYDPKLLSTQKNVDRLSLYLSMQHYDDDRVQAALKDMLNQIEW